MAASLRFPHCGQERPHCLNNAFERAHPTTPLTLYAVQEKILFIVLAVSPKRVTSMWGHQGAGHKPLRVRFTARYLKSQALSRPEFDRACLNTIAVRFFIKLFLVGNNHFKRFCFALKVCNTRALTNKVLFLMQVHKY